MFPSMMRPIEIRSGPQDQPRAANQSANKATCHPHGQIMVNMYPVSLWILV
jgi:hypothetical protein